MNAHFLSRPQWGKRLASGVGRREALALNVMIVAVAVVVAVVVVAGLVRG